MKTAFLILTLISTACLSARAEGVFENVPTYRYHVINEISPNKFDTYFDVDNELIKCQKNIDDKAAELKQQGITILFKSICMSYKVPTTYGKDTTNIGGHIKFIK